MARKPGPTIRRWQLGQELRQFRESVGVTLRAAASEIEVTAATMSKIEGGKQSIKGTHIKLLSPMYDLPAEEKERLLTLATEANQPGWWVTYSKLIPDWFKLFLGYEQDASELKIYTSELVHGLLQTPEYARAVAMANRPNGNESELEKQLELRRERQQRVTREDPPHLHVVLNEAVLLRLVGGPSIMKEQLEHLAQMAALPHVTLQVLLFNAGAHPAMTSSFTMLGFDEEPRMNSVYLENGRGSLYLEKPADLDRYGTMFDQLTKLALSPQASRKTIATVAKNL